MGKKLLMKGNEAIAEAAIRDYYKDSKDADKTSAYLDKWVYGVKDHKEYMDLVGSEALNNLKIRKEN